MYSWQKVFAKCVWSVVHKWHFSCKYLMCFKVEKKNYCLTTRIIKFQITENGVCTTARSNIQIGRHLTYLQEVYHVFHRCASWSVRYIHWKSRLSRKWNSHLPLACPLLIIFSILFSIHFYKILIRRICLTIKSLFSWWSFPLFSWP